MNVHNKNGSQPTVRGSPSPPCPIPTRVAAVVCLHRFLLRQQQPSWGLAFPASSLGNASFVFFFSQKVNTWRAEQRLVRALLQTGSGSEKWAHWEHGPQALTASPTHVAGRRQDCCHSAGRGVALSVPFPPSSPLAGGNCRILRCFGFQ